MLPIAPLFEFKRPIGMGARRQGVYNAPMFAWSIYNDGEPPPFIPGRMSSHATTIWKGIDIDSVIPIQSVKELNAIPDIEVRASCQGHSENPGVPNVNTYMIFKPIKQEESYIKNIVLRLNKIRDIKAGYGLGMMREFRIGVVAPFSYDSDPVKFKKWWNQLPNIIKNVL